MKKLILLLGIIIFFIPDFFSQSCLPDGISFQTQLEIDSFAVNYPYCTEIEGGVWINSDEITNLDGLDQLTSIGGSLLIGYEYWNISNTYLTSIEGLSNLNYIGGSLYIIAPVLQSLDGLESLTTIEEDMVIGPLYFEYGVNSNLTSIESLGNLTFIGGNIFIRNCPVLESLNGLDGLTTIHGLLSLGGYSEGLNMLTDISALSNVDTIYGSLTVTALPITNLDAFNDIDYVGGIWIGRLSNISSLSCFGNITSLTGSLKLNDLPLLTNLSGLENIDANSIESILIRYNTSLTTCEVQSICNYLSTPNATVDIHDNAPGCNSQEEVEEACESVDIYENVQDIRISIFPNPATDILHISSNNGSIIETVIIYNQLGQKVLHRNEIIENIDISALGQGIYIIELTSNELKIREKLVIDK